MCWVCLYTVSGAGGWDLSLIMSSSSAIYLIMLPTMINFLHILTLFTYLYIIIYNFFYIRYQKRKFNSEWMCRCLLSKLRVFSRWLFDIIKGVLLVVKWADGFLFWILSYFISHMLYNIYILLINYIYKKKLNPLVLLLGLNNIHKIFYWGDILAFSFLPNAFLIPYFEGL